ncbi:MAG: SRPBCC family protein [Sulfitobacter sp.]
MRTISLTHDYAAPARDVWEIAIDYECLSEVTAGLVTFEGLPAGRVQAGQSMTVMVSLFGRLPAQPYHMEVLVFDDEKMHFQSSELGAGVKCWNHTLRVIPTENGSQLSDTIEIEAGWATPLFALWARYLYAKRHAPRLRILQRRGT